MANSRRSHQREAAHREEGCSEMIQTTRVLKGREARRRRAFDAFRLRVLGGMTYREIGLVFGVGPQRAADLVREYESYLLFRPRYAFPPARRLTVVCPEDAAPHPSAERDKIIRSFFRYWGIFSRRHEQ